MAHIIVHRIEELARRRLAVAAQRAALPPQPARANLLLWDLSRVPWAHGYSQRYTKYEARAAVQAAAIEQGLDPVAVEELTLDELIVLPDGTIEATIGGVRIITRFPAPAPPPRLPAARYEVLDTGGIISVVLQGRHPDHPVETLRRNGSIPGPARLNAIAIKWTGSATGTGLYNVSLPGLGLQYSHLLVTGGAPTAIDTATIPLGFIITKPEPITLAMEPVDGIAISDDALNVWVSYNHVRALT